MTSLYGGVVIKITSGFSIFYTSYLKYKCKRFHSAQTLAAEALSQGYDTVLDASQ